MKFLHKQKNEEQQQIDTDPCPVFIATTLMQNCLQMKTAFP
jgi:hypothetical protein